MTLGIGYLDNLGRSPNREPRHSPGSNIGARRSKALGSIGLQMSGYDISLDGCVGLCRFRGQGEGANFWTVASQGPLKAEWYGSLLFEA